MTYPASATNNNNYDDDSTTTISTTTSSRTTTATPTTTTVTTTTTTTSTATTLSTKLVHQCRLLLAELDTFLAALATRLRLRRHQQQQHLTEMRQLRSNVLSELKTLERLSAAAAAEQPSGKHDDDDDVSESERRLLHALRSSNLPFYAAVWTVAKERCKGVVAFGKRFYWDDDHHNHNQHHHDRDHEGSDDADEECGMKSKDNTKAKKRPSKDKRKSVFVDIVADNGEEWVKVSTITENRLLFEMAEKGWDRDDYSDLAYSGDEDAGEDADGRYEGKRRSVLPSDTDEEDDKIELVKLASDMAKAARAVRVRSTKSGVMVSRWNAEHPSRTCSTTSWTGIAIRARSPPKTSPSQRYFPTLTKNSPPPSMSTALCSWLSFLTSPTSDISPRPRLIIALSSDRSSWRRNSLWSRPNSGRQW